jgi:hypothetical protein
LNSAQKKFRKEMDKGLKNLKKHNEEAYYKYLAQNHLDDPRQRQKYEAKEKIMNIFRKIFSIIAPIIIISAIAPFAYGKILNLGNKPSSIELSSSNSIGNVAVSPIQNKQKEIVDSLNTIRPYIDNISNDIKKKNDDVQQINNKKITRNDYINSIQAHDELVKKNMADISNITVSSELSTYVNQLNEGYNLLCDGYENELIYLKTNQQKYKKSADDSYKFSNEKLSNSNSELMKVLDNNNIKHQ